ncbi:T9SS type A sorting domain-containing protein [Hymenobacter psychrophilus]|uniref:T9SS type A sorting domain-containing protein n=1 Tax=Hymenobacter psychrophilus TaxID=651662 RepID=UPI000B8196BD|nr:T9SS type A sorting domain-containing protein [Hymenobacter psychrophilus]
MRKPVRNTKGEIIDYENVAPGNIPQVTIKSVFGRNITDRINNTDVIELPLCGGAQTLTLTLPEHYFNSDTNFPVTSYLWGVPPSFTVVGGQPATVFGPNNWLSGRTITIQVPAGQFDELVAVKLWSRECEGPGLNAPATQTSNPQYVRIRRTPPTITTVTGSRTSLTCGDQRPLTLSAILSQSGGASISYNWPATLPNGWTYQTPAPRTGSSVVVIPSGLPGTVTVPVSASYSCSGINGTTAAVAATLTVSSQVAQPAFTAPAAVPAGQFYQLCGPTTFSATPGAAQYRWTTSWGLNFTTTTNSTVITPPPGSGNGSVSVRAQNPALGCTESELSSFVVQYGLPEPLSVNYDDKDLCFTGLVFFAVTGKVQAGYQWSISGSGGIFRFGSTGDRVAVYIRNPNSSFNLSVVATNACGVVGPVQGGTFYTADFRYDCYISDEPRLTVSPNPARENLLVRLEEPAQPALTESTAGKQPAAKAAAARAADTEYAIALYDRFGRSVREGRTRGQQLTLPVADLPAGTYYLRATRGKQSVSRQLLIQP